MLIHIVSKLNYMQTEIYITDKIFRLYSRLYTAIFFARIDLNLLLCDCYGKYMTISMQLQLSVGLVQEIFLYGGKGAIRSIMLEIKKAYFEDYF